MLRIQSVLAIVASALLLFFGAYLGLSRGGTDAAVLGWVLAFVGFLGLVANFVVRGLMR